MSGSDKKDNIFKIIDHERECRGQDGSSLEDLVRHMRLIRDSIPVNDRLRRELRARLTGSPGAIPGCDPPARKEGKEGTEAWRKPWVLALASGVLAVFLLALAFVLAGSRESGQKVLEAGPVSEMARFWAEDRPLAPAVSPSGEVIVVERGGALLLLNRSGSRFATVRPPAGRRYTSPAWSPDGGKLALVREGQGQSEIIQINVPAETGPGDMEGAIGKGLDQPGVLVSLAEGTVSDLSWSPDGAGIAYTAGEVGRGRVFLAREGRDPVSLGSGARPAWSPDGKWLVVEKGGPEDKTLWLVALDGGQSFPLGSGRLPVWNKDGYLIFVKTGIREKILSYLPDGTPQFTVERKVGEIRWLHPGRGEGAERLLPLEGQPSEDRPIMAPDNTAGSEELQWLRGLELGGVRDPRTLYLNRAGDYEGLVPGDGRSLLLSRRDGGTVVLTRIGLVENESRQEGIAH